MATAAFFPPPMPSPPPPPESLFAFYLLAPIAGTLLVFVVILLLCLDANYLRARNRIRHRLEHPPRLAEPTKPLANDGLQFYNSNSKQDYEAFATLKEPSSPAARMKLLPSAVEVVIAEDSSMHGGSFSTHGGARTPVCCSGPIGAYVKAMVEAYAFDPQQHPTYTPEQVNLWIDTANGSRLPAFYLSVPGATLTMLCSHSNAEDLGVTYGIWSRLSKELQVNVLSYEYSGYGHATGRASESNLVADANAALELLTKKFGLIPARDIVLYGRSLGSFPTCALAKRYSVRGVILVSGLASGARFSSIGSLAPSCTDGVALNNIGRISRCTSPVQLIHGTRDAVVPLSHAKAMHQACKAHHPLEPCWIEGARHDGLVDHYAEELIAAIRGFLAHLGGLCENGDDHHAAHASASEAPANRHNAPGTLPVLLMT